MRRKILVAGLFHETHTFLADHTGLEQFRNMRCAVGDEVIRLAAGDGSPMAGFLAAAAEADWEVVPSVHLAAMPSGLVTAEVRRFFNQQFFADLERVQHRLDGIFLVLHGAMVCEDCEDVEGTLLHDLRARLGDRRVPVCGVLDLHANGTAAMAESADCLVAYRENPHTDARETAIRGAGLLGKLLAAGAGRPTTVWRHPPLLLGPRGTASAADPLRAVLQRAREIETADNDILCINVLGGFAYADIPDTGFSVTVTTIGSRTTAEGYADELAAIAVAHREAGNLVDEPIAEVLGRLRPSTAGPTILVESSDNIGGGTPGDGTGALAALRDAQPGECVIVINDPESAARCHAAGVGATLTLAIGGKTDAHHGEPVKMTVEVLKLTDGCFELEDRQSHMASMCGTHIDMKACAVVREGPLRILLTSRKTPPMDLGQLRSQGIEPTTAGIIVVKAAVAHRRAYDGIAAGSYYVDTPGLCSSRLSRFPYRRLRRPIWPLDP